MLDLIRTIRTRKWDALLCFIQSLSSVKFEMRREKHERGILQAKMRAIMSDSVILNSSYMDWTLNQTLMKSLFVITSRPGVDTCTEQDFEIAHFLRVNIIAEVFFGYYYYDYNYYYNKYNSSMSQKKNHLCYAQIMLLVIITFIHWSIHNPNIFVIIKTIS